MESAEIRNRLDGLGCDSLQGFYPARPMPGHQLPAWLADYDRRPVDARLRA